MAGNEQVRIDLVAGDKASKTIDDVADKVEGLEHADPEVHLTADDDASPAIADVADSAEALARLDPEVHLTADDDASKQIDKVRDDAEALARADHELVLRARIDAARGELKSLRDDLETTADKATDVDRRLEQIGRTKGPGLAGNSVADMTGPLGDVSSAASDISGVFDGFADVAASAGARVGLDAEKMAGAITGIGFAITAAAAVWAFYKQRQKQAREAQEELVKGQRDFNKAIAEGDRAAAAAKFVDMYADALDAAAKFGVNAEQATRFIRGQTDALPALDAELRRYNESIAENGGELNAALGKQVLYRDELAGTRADLVDASRKYREANGTLAEQDRRVSDVTRALGGASKATDDFATSQDRADDATRKVNDALDAMRGKLDMDQALIDFRDAFAAAMNDNEQTMAEQQSDVIALKQAIVDAGEATKKSPWQIQTELDAVDEGDMERVRADVEYWYKQYPIILASKLDRPGTGGGTSSGSGGAGPRAVEATPSIGVLNMTLPAGWRGDPIRAAHVSRRRAGRYYARL